MTLPSVNQCFCYVLYLSPDVARLPLYVC